MPTGIQFATEVPGKSRYFCRPADFYVRLFPTIFWLFLLSNGSDGIYPANCLITFLTGPAQRLRRYFFNACVGKVYGIKVNFDPANRNLAPDQRILGGGADGQKKYFTVQARDLIWR